MVGENSEPAIYASRGVSDVYAGYASFDEDSVGFCPDFGETLVHGVVNLFYGFFFGVGFEFVPESFDFGVEFSELAVPHLNHGVGGRSYHEVDAGVGDFGHVLAVAYDDVVLGWWHLRFLLCNGVVGVLPLWYSKKSKVFLR